MKNRRPAELVIMRSVVPFKQPLDENWDVMYYEIRQYVARYCRFLLFLSRFFS